MRPAVRVGDLHTCPLAGKSPHHGGPALPPGEARVLIGDLPAARVGEPMACCGPVDAIISGAATVLIGDRPAARLGEPTAHGGRVVQGFPGVLIGDTPTVAAPGAPLLRLGDDPHWVEVELVDTRGRPVADELFELRLPDGTTLTGALDGEGKVRVEGMDQTGTARLTFPALGGMDDALNQAAAELDAPHRFQLQPARIRALTYNTHLYGSVLFGLETFADSQRAHSLARFLRDDPRNPDVIGLTEVWDIELAGIIIRALSSSHPYVACGPFNDENIEQVLETSWSLGAAAASATSDAGGEDWLAGLAGVGGFLAAGGGQFALNQAGVLNAIGSGLVLLSRFPFVGRPSFHTYAHETGVEERMSQKGVLTAKVRHPLTGGVVGVMLTHAQSEDAESATRLGQMREAAALRDAFCDTYPDSPTVFMGDFNIPGERQGSFTSEYQNARGVLAPMRDAFRQLYPDAAGSPGVTDDPMENGLARFFAGDTPESQLHRSRYDYIFFAPDSSRVERAEVVRYRDPQGFADDAADTAGTIGRTGRHLLQRVSEDVLGLPLGELPRGQQVTVQDVSDHYGLYAAIELDQNG